MSPTFDQVVTALVRTCEAQPNFNRTRRACLVRDLEGRVRLVLDHPKTTISDADKNKDHEALDIDELGKRLRDALGHYFAGPILTTTGATDERRLAHSIIDQATEWPRAWSLQRDAITGVEVVRGNYWRVLQRLHSKHAWLSALPVDPPWELRGGSPAIVSFYSFKGGVGRTTLLTAVARLLAASNKRVVVIDLDLEAPGLGAFLGVDTDRGAIDFIVDYLVTRVPDLQSCKGAAAGFGDVLGAQVDVIPAGRMSLSYLEKLARLDFTNVDLDTRADSPVGRALRALVEAVRNELNPDYILIDSRAGLHDIGGLSLHALAHVDVLVSRATSQNVVGLEIALQTLGQRKRAEDLRRVLVAHTFAPRREDPEAPTTEELEFRQQVYELFSNWIYEDGDVEERDVDDAPHFPWTIGQHVDLERISSVAAAPSAVLDGDDFRRLCDRIVELCEPEEGIDDVEEADVQTPADPESGVPVSMSESKGDDL